MGIVWLASYPKSGNTWVRAFLANYLADQADPVPINALAPYCYNDRAAVLYERVSGRSFQQLSDRDLNSLRPRVHVALAQQESGAVFVKTHNAIVEIEGVPTVHPASTLGAVYVLRNPLDVAVSYAHHYGLSYAAAIDNMARSAAQVARQDRAAPQLLGSWSDHVGSWTRNAVTLLALVRFEDLRRRPDDTFAAVVRAVRLPFDRRRLKQAIRHAAFKTLRGMEDQSGFVESSRASEAFFRKGAVGDWRAELSPAEVARVIDCHGPMMRRFGYLDARGKPVDGGPIPRAEEASP